MKRTLEGQNQEDSVRFAGVQVSSTSARYGVSILISAALLAAQLALRPWLHAVLSLYPLAVTLSAFTGGLGPGLLTTALSILIAYGPVTRTAHTAEPGGSYNAARLGVLVVVGAGISLLSEALHRARRRAEATAQALRESQVKLEAAKTAAETANSAKDQFLATLSHELRTPLTPVLATVSMLETDQRLDDDIRQDMEVVRRNVELEARLIDDLLDLTRIVRGKLELRKEPVDIHRVLEHAMNVCGQADAFGKQLQIRQTLKATEHSVWGDAARLEQIFWNLLNNAIKFTHSPGRIDICTCNPQPGIIHIEVRDTGVGIDPQDIDHIFDAFEQGGRAVTRQFGGLGLGLAISRRLVAMHEGSVSARSEGKGKGACFTVELPLLTATDAVARIGASDRRRDEPARAPGKLRILLVEDHADTAHIMRQLLRQDGHEVQTAGDVASALELSARQTFDLVISDLGLPDGSGLDLMRQLRGVQTAIKGIALSGYGRAEDVAESREAGFVEHIIKPIDVSRLQAAIARVTANGATVASSEG